MYAISVLDVVAVATVLRFDRSGSCGTWPLSRQSLGDLATGAQTALGQPISRSTVCRILARDAIEPWQYRYWIFPRDPLFAGKAAPILDRYEGLWQGQPVAVHSPGLKVANEGTIPFS
jgi:hypothetical protein